MIDKGESLSKLSFTEVIKYNFIVIPAQLDLKK